MSELKYKWWEYHKENPHVYELVEKFTFDVIKRGYDRYSINSIFERIRWHTDIDTEGDKFKISNNHRAYYARYFMHLHPQYDGFFKTKELRSWRLFKRHANNCTSPTRHPHSALMLMVMSDVDWAKPWTKMISLFWPCICPSKTRDGKRKCLPQWTSILLARPPQWVGWLLHQNLFGSRGFGPFILI